MPLPDQKYLPKAKGKTKTKKVRVAAETVSFPKVINKIDTRPMKKKKSPNGDHYVWAK
jgi:hypothetical protein